MGLTPPPPPQMENVKVTQGRGAASGALTALAALGPQEKYMFGGESLWIPELKQHSPFAQTHRLLNPLLPTGANFLNPLTSCSIDIKPREEPGDLLSNMYLSVALPALPTGYNYTPLVGRAILHKVEFLIDGQVIESIEDDWYIIRDQLFLDANQKLSTYQMLSLGQAESNVVPAVSQVDMMIPLDFFFCRKRSHNRTGAQRNERPYLPICAMKLQTITIRFTFNNAAWITNAPSDVNGNPIDLINPRVLVEEITVSDAERVYYMTTPISYRVIHTWKEAVQEFNNGQVRLNLTANFPVSMIAWFIRNNLYETPASTYWRERYSYGYTTDFLPAAVPVTFFNGVKIDFLDSIQSATIYLDNKNILSNFPGALYYSYRQPLQHALSVPTKNIYMYCFGDRPKDYDNAKYINFSDYNSETSHLDITFNPTLTPQIQQTYTLYLYYLGYSTLQIGGGRSKFIP
jgi:hypothetical protein